MEPFDLRTFHSSGKLEKVVCGQSFETSPLKVVLDKHSLAHRRRKHRLQARMALGLWLELYDYAAIRDGARLQGRAYYADGGHVHCFIRAILDFALAYREQVPANGHVSPEVLRPASDYPRQDFCDDFERFCASHASAEGHVLLWRALASLCRAVGEAERLPLDDLFRLPPTVTDVLPDLTGNDAIAFISDCDIPEDQYSRLLIGSHGPEVCSSAFRQALPDAGFEDMEAMGRAFAGIGELYTIAADFCCPQAWDLRGDATAGGLHDFCSQAGLCLPDVHLFDQSSYHRPTQLTLDDRRMFTCFAALEQATPIRTKPNPDRDYQLDFAAASLRAMRSFCKLVTSPQCRFIEFTIAWLYHILRLRCEWEIAEIMNQ